jgi:hypothetical protein
MLRRGKSSATRTSWLVLLGAALSASTASATARPAGKPAYVWLWYADGASMPDFSEYCSEIHNPPAYKCNFGSSQTTANVADCQSEVQRYLDDWYKDFNVVFTLTRPPTGDYYVVVITSGWPACAQESADRTGGVAANEGGIAPFNMNCVDNVNQTAIAIQCGTNAHDCATIIAHEHAHLVGLVHTTGGEDVMHASVQATSDGFLNASLGTVLDWSNNCSTAKQNSYRQMLDSLGPWPGGAKPSLFSSLDGGVKTDASAGDARTADVPDAKTTGGSMGPGQDDTDATVTVLPGFDAYTRAPPVLPDASAVESPKKSGGCNLLRAPTTPPLALAAGLLLALWRSLRRRELSRSSTRPGRRPTGSP